jgi:hypothetical protein
MLLRNEVDEREAIDIIHAAHKQEANDTTTAECGSTPMCKKSRCVHAIRYDNCCSRVHYIHLQCDNDSP